MTLPNNRREIPLAHRISLWAGMSLMLVGLMIGGSVLISDISTVMEGGSVRWQNFVAPVALVTSQLLLMAATYRDLNHGIRAYRSVLLYLGAALILVTVFTIKLRSIP